ncbi:unnamed protein product [Cuscuta campestris]|uniref:phosphoribosylanthranilate isomerase n=1 Tax=Cuscuta campestris TaxID=132261 RepID=A0A484LME9_9ASTE|nr:unnamed protein product [Cuscuta campestris]
MNCICGQSRGIQVKPNIKNLLPRDLSSRETYSFSIKTFRRSRTCVLKRQPTKVSCAHKGQQERRHLVKMCGITSARDAALAAEAGADFIGMIIWPYSKRSVSLAAAKEISKVAREYGAKPVGVFVDDNAETILNVANAADLELVQLHGNGSRVAFPILVKEKKVIYVLHVNEAGELLNTISDEDSSLVDWVLVDSARGGSGKGFNWAGFKLPEIRSKCGWLLAGGINPGNVCEALCTLNPQGVDVSSGICAPDGIQKDKLQIASFMNAVQHLR